jgi:hypothetical protein
MASETQTAQTVTTTINGAGSLDWNDATAARLDAADGSLATCTPWAGIYDGGDPPAIINYSAEKTYLVNCSNFGFALPAGDIVTNISVRVRHYQSNSRYAGSNIGTETVKFTGGTNLATGDDLEGTATDDTFSGSPEYWGLSAGLTGASVNDSGFTFQLAYIASPDPLGAGSPVPSYPVVSVDIVEVTITTTSPYLKVDAVEASYTYTIPTAGTNVQHDYLAFSPLRKLWALRSSGHIDELEWNSATGQYIDGPGRDGGYEMPEGFWKSPTLRGRRLRVSHVSVDRDDTDETMGVVVQSDELETEGTLAIDKRTVRFPVTQHGWNHSIKFIIAETSDGINRAVAFFKDLSKALRR